MANPDPVFDQPEYDARVVAVRAAMERSGIDILFCEDPSNMAWLTGYDGYSFYVHQGVIVTASGPPIWWGRPMDMAGAWRKSWLPDTHIHAYPDDHVMSEDKHPMDHLGALIRTLGGGAARVGVEMENYYYSAKAHAVLTAALPDAQLVDATNLVNWCRLVKSKAELSLMRKAARIVEKMIDGAVERIEPGLPKNQLVADIYRDATMGVDGAWGDYAAIAPMLPSGPDAAAAHLTWDGKPFQAGEATFFELAGCHHRYHVPFCRTVFLGTPPDEMRRAEAALVDGLNAGIDAARPGNRVEDIAAALAKPLAAAGIDRGARCGYSIGLSYPPDWGERTISIRDGDQTELRENMTLHFMPGIWMDDWGLEITEPIRIRESGPAECLCDRPRELFVKP